MNQLAAHVLDVAVDAAIAHVEPFGQNDIEQAGSRKHVSRMIEQGRQ